MNLSSIKLENSLCTFAVEISEVKTSTLMGSREKNPIQTQSGVPKTVGCHIVSISATALVPNSLSILFHLDTTRNPGRKILILPKISIVLAQTLSIQCYTIVTQDKQMPTQHTLNKTNNVS